ncbi:MAG: shikimate dehydrogenase [Leptospirillia bacterium]
MRKLFAIIGHPVAHSLSPRFQQAAFDAAGIDAAYLPFDIPPENLPHAIDAIRTLGISGVNVTIPHKEAILPLLDELSPTAKELGAVNTVTLSEGRLLGDNTDAPGFLSFLEKFLDTNRLALPSSAVVFGAGGSARSVLWALSRRHVSRILIVNRTKERGAALIQSLPFLCKGVRSVSLDDPSWQEVLEGGRERQALTHSTKELQEKGVILVNTLSLQAFAGTEPPFPPLQGVPLEDSILMDLSYVSHRTGPQDNGGLTPFLSMGRPFAAPCQNGLGMLLMQGALSFRRWTGCAPSIDIMEAALRQATGQDDLWKSL